MELKLGAIPPPLSPLDNDYQPPEFPKFKWESSFPWRNFCCILCGADFIFIPSWVINASQHQVQMQFYTTRELSFPIMPDVTWTQGKTCLQTCLNCAPFTYCRLSLTEDGESKNPQTRALSSSQVSHFSSIDQVDCVEPRFFKLILSCPTFKKPNPLQPNVKNT